MNSLLMRCPDCGLFLLTSIEKEPTVYRFCPKCGERKLYDSTVSVARLAEKKPRGRRKADPSSREEAGKVVEA